MNIIPIANDLDMSYDFYIKHNMDAVEWNLNAMVNENKILITKLDRIWRYPLVLKFINVPILNM